MSDQKAQQEDIEAKRAKEEHKRNDAYKQQPFFVKGKSFVEWYYKMYDTDRAKVASCLVC
jgi:hypothetical protein